MRHPLSIGGLANVRDLGGLRRADGGLTPGGVFVRAELLDQVDDGGWDALHGHGVRTVIDLRRPSEIAGATPAPVPVVNVDLDGDERSFWEPIEADGRWGTPLYYLSHLHDLPHRLAGVLGTIAAADDGAVLFHCGAGWDRTGLVAAVLLKALEVTEDAAAEDYLASFENAAAMEALHGRSFEVRERLAILTRFGHTPESAFRAMYRELDLQAWFRHAEVDDRTRDSIATWRGAAR
jgi:protein-tyrosine phosphatase